MWPNGKYLLSCRTLSLRAGSWHCLVPEHPQDVTLWMLLRQGEGWSSQLVLKQEKKLTCCKCRKKVALKEIMEQPGYHKALCGLFISSTAGHCHWHCQGLWDFCRDTKSAPAVRYSSTPEKLHSRFLIILIKPLGKVCPSPKGRTRPQHPSPAGSQENTCALSFHPGSLIVCTFPEP